MLIKSIFTTYSLLSLGISSLLFLLIATIALLVGATSAGLEHLTGFYIQSMGYSMPIFSGLLLLSSVPVVPAEDKPIKSADLNDGKPKRLTNLEKQQFELPEELEQILVGLLLGDLHVEKDKRAINGNARLRFVQGTVHKEYLLDLYELFKDFCPADPKLES